MPIFSDQMLSRLPAPSREKIARLDSDRDFAHAAVRTASDALQEARRAHGLALSHARHLYVANFPGQRDLEADFRELAGKTAPPPTPESYRSRRQEVDTERAQAVARLMEPIVAHQRTIERLSAAHDRAVAAWSAYSFLEPALAWLTPIVGSGVTLQHQPARLAKVPKDLRAEVAALRSQLDALADEWRAVDQSPAPRADFLERALREIQSLADKGKPTIDLRRRGPTPIKLAEHLSVNLTTFGTAENAISRLVGDASAFHVWLHRETLISRIKELIDAAPNDGALSFDEREKRFSEINAKKLAIEFQEEATILAAEAAGMAIARRRDADPRAVLEVSEV